MICSFCGLETGSPTAHETQEACIEALRTQVSELRSVLRHSRRPGEPLDLDLPNQAVVEAARTRSDGKPTG
jgi:hypothetical protein